MSEWQQYTATVAQHTVVGDLRLYKGLHSPQLNNDRDVMVWLPAGYDSSDQRYPVLYMHDGLNLFDEHVSHSGEWQVDETMQALAAEGYAAIIVGLLNMGQNRVLEYNPYDGSVGADYVRFITETVKPLIDSHFRTRLEVAYTGLAGSSMGGLISLYGFLRYQDVFGFCGAFSTAYWFGNEGLLPTIAEYARGMGKIYLDVGTQEGIVLKGWNLDQGDPDGEYVAGVRRLRAALLAHGYEEPKTLLYVEEAGALHNEPAWAKRLPEALRFLLPHD